MLIIIDRKITESKRMGISIMLAQTGKNDILLIFAHIKSGNETFQFDGGKENKTKKTSLKLPFLSLL